MRDFGAANAASASEQRLPLADILDRLPIGFAVFDQAGRHVFRGGALRRIIGPVIGSYDPHLIALWQIFDTEGKRVTPEYWPSVRALRGERIKAGFIGVYGKPCGISRRFRIIAIPLDRRGGAAEGAVLLQTCDRTIGSRAEPGATLKPLFVEALVDAMDRRRSRQGPVHPGASHGILTHRETEVLKLIALGHSNKEIAIRLGISVKTVEFHRAGALEKLSLRSRADIVRYALAHQWLHPAPAADS